MRTRKERRLQARQGRAKFVRLPGSSKPFKRAIKLHQEFIDTLAKYAQDLPVDRQIAVAALPTYTSRGHGGKHRTMQRKIGGAWSKDRSRPRSERAGHDIRPALAFVDAIAAKIKLVGQSCLLHRDRPT